MSADCLTCGKQLGRRNRSGYCARHLSAALATDPVWREKQRRGSQLSLQCNPERLAIARETIRRVSSLPHAVEARRNHCVENRLWERGNAAQPKGSDARMKAGARSSATKLAWCPANLRPDYRELARVIPAAEARGLILAQHERDMAAFRRKLGVVPDEPEPEPTVPMLDPALPAAERILATAAAVFNVALDSPSRWAVRARWAAMLALSEHGLSLGKIARAVGLTDHTSVMYGLEKARPLLANDAGFAARAEIVRSAA